MHSAETLPHTAALGAHRLDSLDALRALAIALVLAHHVHAYLPQLWPGGGFAPGPWDAWLAYAWVGVDLFYVLSGFFIGRAVLSATQWDPVRFFRSRATRILPAYYVSMVFALVTVERALVATPRGPFDIALHVLMLHSLQPWSFFSINGPYWTLGIEWMFYLFMLVVAPFWRARRGWLLLPAMVVVAIVWKGAVLVGMPADQRFFWSAQLPGALDEFALGMLVAWCSLNGRLPPWLLARPGRAVFGIVLVLGGIALAAACVFHYTRLRIDYWSHGPTVMLSRLVLGTGFALLLAGFLVLQPLAAWRLAVRRSGLQALGRISFSVYLYHIPVILLMRQLAGADRPASAPVLAAVWIAATLAVSAASHRWIERRWHPSA